MYEVHAFPTPNSVKVPIALEELVLPYVLKAVDIRQGEHRSAAFTGLNPNGKVPVLVERNADGRCFVLTESAAILVYLAEISGRLLPASGPARARTFEQLFFHASGLGPAFGQSGFFQRFAPEPQPIALERFATEADRTLRVLDGVLGRHRFVAGDGLTIADIAHFGWLWRRGFPNVTLDETPNVARWYAEMQARPAVQRGIDRLEALAVQA